MAVMLDPCIIFARLDQCGTFRPGADPWQDTELAEHCLCLCSTPRLLLLLQPYLLSVHGKRGGEQVPTAVRRVPSPPKADTVRESGRAAIQRTRTDGGYICMQVL